VIARMIRRTGISARQMRKKMSSNIASAANSRSAGLRRTILSTNVIGIHTCSLLKFSAFRLESRSQN
jgi:hypothetical protein